MTSRVQLARRLLQILHVVVGFVSVSVIPIVRLGIHPVGAIALAITIDVPFVHDAFYVAMSLWWYTLRQVIAWWHRQPTLAHHVVSAWRANRDARMPVRLQAVGLHLVSQFASGLLPEPSEQVLDAVTAVDRFGQRPNMNVPVAASLLLPFPVLTSLWMPETPAVLVAVLFSLLLTALFLVGDQLGIREVVFERIERSSNVVRAAAASVTILWALGNGVHLIPWSPNRIVTVSIVFTMFCSDATAGLAHRHRHDGNVDRAPLPSSFRAVVEDHSTADKLMHAALVGVILASAPTSGVAGAVVWTSAMAAIARDVTCHLARLSGPENHPTNVLRHLAIVLMGIAVLIDPTSSPAMAVGLVVGSTVLSVATGGSYFLVPSQRTRPLDRH